LSEVAGSDIAPTPDWAKLPDGWSLKEIGRVGLGGNDNAYAFDRVEHPMIVFDRSGNFLRSGVKASP
jgi:hypothetical protein